MPRSFKSSQNDCEANCGPQSEIILFGNPNLLYRLSKSRVATCSAVIIFEHGRRITPFVRPWFTMTNRESSLFTTGKSVIMSIEQYCKGSGCLSPFSGYVGWVGRVSVNFELLTNSTSLHLVLYKGPKPRPPVLVFYCIVCFQFTRVSCGLMVMVHLHNVPSEVNIPWNVVFSFVEYCLSIFQAFHFPIVQIIC